MEISITCLALAAYAVLSLGLEIIDFKVAIVLGVVRTFKPLILRLFEENDKVYGILVNTFAILP